MSNIEKYSNPEVTVGIVCFNTALPILEKAVISLKKSQVDVEIIVLCNSPSEDYQKKIAQVCQDHRIKALLHEENNGFGAGHNRIFSQAHGSWYVCCNPDVQVATDSIRVLIEASFSLDRPVLLMPKVLSANGEIQKLCRRNLTLLNWMHRNLWQFFQILPKPFEQRFEYNKVQKVEFVSGCFFAIHAKHFRQLQGFSNDFFLYCEDADLSRRAQAIGNNYFVPNAVIYHEWSKHSSRSWNSFTLHVKSLIKYFLKYGFV